MAALVAQCIFSQCIFSQCNADRRASGAGLGPRSTLEQLRGAWGDDPRWAALDVPAKAKCALNNHNNVAGSPPAWHANVAGVIGRLLHHNFRVGDAAIQLFANRVCHACLSGVQHPHCWPT